MRCDHTRPEFGCDGCIAKASVGAGLGEGGQLWRIEVERRGWLEIYVVAPTKEQARADAEELVSGFNNSDFDMDDDELFIYEMEEGDEPSGNEPVWTGGPNGGWTSFQAVST